MHALTQTRQKNKSQVDIDEKYLIMLAKRGSADAHRRLVQRYARFVRLKASSYFIAGGDSDDLFQEGLIGLHKAIRDYQPNRESSFRAFVELCVTRQIISAIKAATRHKHALLNQYVSFSSTPMAGANDSDGSTLEEMLPGPAVDDPAHKAASSEELRALVACLSTTLTELEAQVFSLYIDGYTYQEIAVHLQCGLKAVDNALQRVKKKISLHLDRRERRSIPMFARKSLQASL